jgi:hypothetical protein
MYPGVDGRRITRRQWLRLRPHLFLGELLTEFELGSRQVPSRRKFRSSHKRSKINANERRLGVAAADKNDVADANFVAAVGGAVPASVMPLL